MRWLILFALWIVTFPAFAQAPNLSSATVTATGGTTARTTANRAADQIFSADYGAVCDGTTNDATSLQNAINAAVAAKKRLWIQSTTSSCLTNSTLTISGPVEITGLNSPKIKSGVTGTVFSATSVSGVYIHDLTLDGNYPTTPQFAPIVYFTTVTNSRLDNLTLVNPGGELRLYTASNGNIISRVTMTNSANAGVVVDASCDNQILNNQFNGQTGFGVILQNGACRNLVQGNSASSSGLELVGVNYTAFDNKIISNIVRSSGDNCYSITGYRNVISGNTGIGCQGSGITLYGEYNTVTGNVLIDNGQGNAGNTGWSAGIAVIQASGGIGQNNVITGNFADDDQAVPTQLYGMKIFPAGYTVWSSGLSVAANGYYYFGLNLYKAGASGTTGASAPTCTSGTCSDGTITWTYVNTFSGSIQPDFNVFSGNVVNRFGTAIVQDSSVSTHNSGIRCAQLSAESSAQVAPGNSCNGIPSVAFGQSVTVTGGNSGGFGSGHTVSGGSAFAFGSTDTADANYSMAIGKQAATWGVINSFCLGATAYSVAGDKERCEYVLGAAVSNTSQNVLTTDGTASQGANNMIIMRANSAAEVSCRMLARKPSTGDSAEFSITDALFTQGATASTTAPVGSPTWTTGAASAGATGVLTPAIIANTSLGGIGIAVTATSGTWHVTSHCTSILTQ